MEKDQITKVKLAKQKEENEHRPAPRKDRVVTGINITSI